MPAIRALVLTPLVGMAIGMLAWFAVSALGELLHAWIAGGCSLELVYSGVGLC
jgi:hypothetical protein